jgi:CheY-like chemotaxis protein
MDSKKILWADDEIELLKPHILFLEKKGYNVTGVTNGDDAISLMKEKPFDLVLLDEMMVGLDGLSVLRELKSFSPETPVIMITKNEEEKLMEEAIGKKIDDYLTKPVNPSQILSAAKRILDSRTIRSSRIGEEYAMFCGKLRMKLMSYMSWQDWIDTYVDLCNWDIEFDKYKNSDLIETHKTQWDECNTEFSKYISKNYENWMNGDSPTLSPDVFQKYVADDLADDKKTYFIVMDCMRLDQWMMIEDLLREYFNIDRDYYYSILPTATPYARNAIFSGLFPLEIYQRYPHYWIEQDPDESSKNRFERQMVERQLTDLKIRLRKRPKYIKVFTTEEAIDANRQMASMNGVPLISLVFNFTDILVHNRSELEIMKEIAPDEPAFRSLTRSWFSHSPLLETFKLIAKQGARVVLTSDHGSVLSKKAALVRGDRETSPNLRYKYGKNLGCDEKEAILLKNPEKFNLPAETGGKNYLIAKENYYFVYPNNFNEYKRQYDMSFQHGGISLEEMILPVVTMTPKQ